MQHRNVSEAFLIYITAHFSKINTTYSESTALSDYCLTCFHIFIKFCFLILIPVHKHVCLTKLYIFAKQDSCFIVPDFLFLSLFKKTKTCSRKQKRELHIMLFYFFILRDEICTQCGLNQ